MAVLTAMTDKILLCTDLDRTVLPNGPQLESPRARPALRRLAARPEVTLVYVSGRHKQLLQAAIDEFDLPVPDYAVGDVGTTVYHVHDGSWSLWEDWSREIAPDWNGLGHAELAQLFADLQGLRLQEPDKQNTFKLSYYAPPDADVATLTGAMGERLAACGVRASLTWSIDEAKHLGLLDVLPESATKYHAIRFLMARQGFAEAETVFAGDSGNDLSVLTSGLQAVVVRNASDAVRREALEGVRANGPGERLYLAEGGFLGMNGNYAAGVLEGVVHFFPEVRSWLE